MKRGISITVLLLAILCSNYVYAQVHSVQSGKWYWPSVWSNNTVPDSSVDVVLNHPVSDGGSCRNLTINSGGVIWDGGYSIYGNLINHGQIDATRPAWYDLYVHIRGNIYNTGKYWADYTHFTGKNDQHVSSTDTLKLGIVRDLDASSAVIFDSTITVAGSWMDFNRSNLILTDTLIMVNSTIYGCDLQGNGHVIEGKPGFFGWTGAVVWSPDYTLLDDVVLSGYNYLYGWGNDIWGLELHNIVNNGYIHNSWVHGGGQARVQISGTLTNNHTIRDQQDGLIFEVQGADIVNHAEMRNRGIKFFHDSHFSSDGDSSLGFTTFEAADSSVTVTIDNPSLTFKEMVSFNFNGGNLVLPENGQINFDVIDGSGYTNINITGNNSELSGYFGDNATAENIQSYYLIPWGNSGLITGDLVVTNTLLPRWNYGADLLVDGSIKNLGKVIDNSYHQLRLNVTGNIYNGGQWSNNKTTLVGEYDQIIELVNDSSIVGQVIFDAMIEGTAYQWTHDGIDIQNAAMKTLSFDGITPDNSGVYQCRVTQNGVDTYSRTISVNSPSSINDSEINVVHEFKLSQNYPNPFNPDTKIRFSLPEASLVTLSVFDILGQKVSTIINRELAAGNHEFPFYAASLSSGLYFYKLESKNHIAIKRMMLLK